MTDIKLAADQSAPAAKPAITADGIQGILSDKLNELATQYQISLSDVLGALETMRIRTSVDVERHYHNMLAQFARDQGAANG